MSIRNSVNRAPAEDSSNMRTQGYKIESAAILELINRFKEPFQVTCERCNGTGESTVKGVCKTCKGSGKIFIDLL